MDSGPVDIGTLCIASSFKKVHALMHTPLGDDYLYAASLNVRKTISLQL